MMPFLTAAVLAAFVGYAGAWYFELVEGNFALLLFLATVVTGLYWVAERLWYLPRRRRAAAELEANAGERNARLAQQGEVAFDELEIPRAGIADESREDRGREERHH